MKNRYLLPCAEGPTEDKADISGTLLHGQLWVTPLPTNPTSSLLSAWEFQGKEAPCVCAFSAGNRLHPFELHWSLMSGKTVSLTRQLRLSLSPEYFTPWCNSCHWKIFPSFWKAKVSMPQDWFLWRNVHLLAVPNYSTEKLPASPPEDRVHDLRSTPALCSQLLPVSRCPLTPQ